MMRASSGGVANEACKSSTGVALTSLSGRQASATNNRIAKLRLQKGVDPAKAQRRKVSSCFMFSLRLRAFAGNNSEKDPDPELNVTRHVRRRCCQRSKARRERL